MNAMEGDLKRTSRFLSLVLRHEPETIGLKLDEQGWVDVDELQRCMNAAGRQLTRELLEQVVAENDKKRFGFSADGLRIRANQGHSLEIDLALPPVEPPESLYHGTATRFLDSIRRQGLIPRSRRHVHLSLDTETATKVGQRHGKPHVLTVRSDSMHAAGIAFYRSENGVWLTEHVAPEYIRDFPAH